MSLMVKAKQSRWFDKFCTEILVGNTVKESDMLAKLQWCTRIVLHVITCAILQTPLSSVNVIACAQKSHLCTSISSSICMSVTAVCLHLR